VVKLAVGRLGMSRLPRVETTTEQSETRDIVCFALVVLVVVLAVVLVCLSFFFF
jgi:hypothetical protein